MLVKLSDARSGLDFWSCLRWGLSAHSSPIKRLYEVIAYTIAYLIATRGESYPVPDEFQKKGAVPQAIVERQRTLAEIEEAYDITIDRDALSERGRELFYGDITDISYREYREQSATTGGDE